MLKRRLARVFSFIAVLVLVFTMASSPAYAMGKQQFSAWVAAAISALNITVQSTFTPAADLGNKWNDFLSAPFVVEQQQIIDLPYTYSQNDIDSYLDRSVIQIDKDSVTIDGVEYSDIWLSNDAAEKFRVNAFDIENAYDLASHSEGTFVEGVGYASGVPMFSVDGIFRSQNYVVTYPTPDSTSWTDPNVVRIGDFSVYARSHLYAGREEDQISFKLSGNPSYSYSGYNGGQNTFYLKSYNGAYRWHSVQGSRFGDSAIFTSQPFDFDWVSGTIPADEPLPSDSGLNIRVPTSVINQWYIDYPDTGDSVTYNMGDPELTTKIDDLIDLIVPLIPILDIDFTTSPEPAPQPEPEPVPEPDPYPDPDPQPGTVLPDIDWTDLFRTVKNIYQNISISNSWLESIKNLLDKIKWLFDDLLDLLRDFTDSLFEEIETGPLKIFDKILDLFKSIFLPFFLPLKLALSIWSYVTTWLSTLASSWQIFSSILPVAIRIPIYGTFAAFVCISIFKKVIH